MISTSNIPYLPQDVCSTGQHEAAVAVDDNNDRHEILLVRVKAGKIEKMRTTKCQHTCTVLAHHDGHLYVAARSALHMYDMAGGQCRQLYSDKTGEKTVARCAISHDGSRIYITNHTHGQLSTQNKGGTKLSTFNLLEMRYPATPHVTAQGHMFVTCYGRNTVVQVTEREEQPADRDNTGWEKQRSDFTKVIVH